MDTPPFLQTLLREFEEEMREHGESNLLRMRFYGYLQTAIESARNAPVQPGQTEDDEKPPPCPWCDTALQPERLNAGRWRCPCCARIFSALPRRH